MKCPICKKEVEFGSPLMPFCSDRCRLIDLGMWSNEEYRIPSSQPATPSEKLAQEDEDGDE